MTPSIDGLMYEASQLFLIPVLAAIGLLFLYAFYALGAFLWQMVQRRAGVADSRLLRHRPGARS